MREREREREREDYPKKFNGQQPKIEPNVKIFDNVQLMMQIDLFVHTQTNSFYQCLEFIQSSSSFFWIITNPNNRK